MVDYGTGPIRQSERVMLLHGWLARKHHTHWFTKKRTIRTLKKWPNAMRCNDDTLFIKVHKILWDNRKPWGMSDEVFCESLGFNMYRYKELDDLVGYLFKASIDGYMIRYASQNVLVGIYLERSKDGSTNIDDEVIDTLVEVTHKLMERDS